MIEDEDRAADDISPPATNDLPSPKRSSGFAQAGNDNGGDTSVRIDAAVLTIARLIGQQIAREAFERLKATNDNVPPERRED